jgi:DHA1 family bicyclomycin/chloramphenicol resistance-like MFS transporter
MRAPTRPHATGIPVAVLLTALVALGPISTDLYLPSLPGMARDLKATVPEVQLTLSLFLAGLALGQLVYGPLSDRFGRRPVLLAGVVLYFIASLACVVAPSMTVLVVARFIQALGACAGPVLCRAVVRDVHGREGSARVLSYMAAAMALAPALGPIVGGFLEVAFGWRANFVALAIYGFAGLVAAAAILPETNATPDTEAVNPLRILATYLGLMRQRVFLGYVLCAAFAYSTIFSFISGSPFVLVDMVGLAPDAYGFCFAAVVVGYIVGAVASGRLTRKLGIDRLIAVGGAVASSAGVVLLIVGWSGVAWHGVSGAIAIVLPQAVVMAGAGLVMSNAFAGAIGPFPRQAGAASALSGFLQMSVAALAGLAVGHFFDGTARAMTAAIALAGLLIPLTYRLLVRAGAKSDRADAG